MQCTTLHHLASNVRQREMKHVQCTSWDKLNRGQAMEHQWMASVNVTNEELTHKNVMRSRFHVHSTRTDETLRSLTWSEVLLILMYSSQTPAMCSSDVELHTNVIHIG